MATRPGRVRGNHGARGGGGLGWESGPAQSWGRGRGRLLRVVWASFLPKHT